MFYDLITQKRNQWLLSDDCAIRPMIQYIEQRGMMRDAQIEAIKTYLYLKIACKGQSLCKLFSAGYFNDTNIGAEELTSETRQTLENNKAALALFQYSRLKDKTGKQLAPDLEAYIRHHAQEIDYEKALCEIFYGVKYADYLFSLPMGAGKTYLMAAFIYIDLYFAQNEPNNPIWAHNFLIAVPASLKSSIIPSLKNIRNFDPTWVLPESSALAIKRIIKFEILDEGKNAKKSNKVRDPNAQKINLHLSSCSPMGLIAVANAEKLYDGIDKSIEDPGLYTKEQLKQIKEAGELRRVIGKLPHLSVLIDEVHHATDDGIKLRQAVTDWATNNDAFCNVLGFSGTPYLDKAEKTTIGGTFVIKNTNISNVVYYYPLIDGIDNFLKRPDIKHSDSSSDIIIQNGVREFFNKYKDTTYADGTKAKLAVYCGQIPTLEEVVYPLVAELVTEIGLNPAKVILKRHKGNSQYPEPAGSDAAFASLNSSLSDIRIVLLAQIGKEGWDCKSLTGVILPHEGVCPNNMVLQTSCRCLRQVIKGQQETALIWMNKKNAAKLDKELKQQQNISLKELVEKPQPIIKHIERFSRMEQQKVPPIDYYQFRVIYKTIEIEKESDTTSKLSNPAIFKKQEKTLVTIQDLNGKVISYDELALEKVDDLSFRWWLHEIARESFGSLSVSELLKFESQLHIIFEKSHTDEYDQSYIRSMIRKAFVPKRDFKIIEEIVPEKASILSVEHLEAIDIIDDSRIYPKEFEVKEILEWDSNPQKGNIPQDKLLIIEQMKKIPGITKEMIQAAIGISVEQDPHEERHKTFHYLPYRFDSNLELNYFSEALKGIMHDRNLEYYFNGDDSLTDFKIQCYRKTGNHWQYDGLYVPDFLVISRNEDGELDRICIIETKGEGYAAKFKDRLEFMQKVFVPLNNEKYGRNKFDFLYLEDTKTPEQRVKETITKINDFFK